jgi:hypothetical protein
MINISKPSLSSKNVKAKIDINSDGLIEIWKRWEQRAVMTRNNRAILQLSGIRVHVFPDKVEVREPYRHTYEGTRSVRAPVGTRWADYQYGFPRGQGEDEVRGAAPLWQGDSKGVPPLVLSVRCLKTNGQATYGLLRVDALFPL